MDTEDIKLARYENVVVPQIGSIIFLSDDRYIVKEVTYDYSDPQDYILIDVIMKEYINN